MDTRESEDAPSSGESGGYSRAPQARTFWRRTADFARRTGWAAWLALIGLGIFEGVPPAYRAVIGDPPAISEQLEEIRRDAATEGFHAIVNRPADLHATGTRSWLIVLRHDSINSGQPRVKRVSDEVRIFDEVDGELQEKLRFQPRPKRGLVYVFGLKQLGDADGNGRPEIVGSYSSLFMSDELPVPFVIAWSERDDRYVMSPLIRDPPTLNESSRPGTYGRIARRRYGENAQLEDTRAPRSHLRGYPVEEFVLARRRGLPVLLAGFIHRQAIRAAVGTIEVHAWSIDFQRPEARSYQCSSSGVTFRMSRASEESLAEDIRKAFTRHREAYC